MLEKVEKIMGVLSGIMAVIAIVMFILSKMDLSFLFGPQTYDVDYVPGVYTTDGYISHLMGYRFETPKGCDLGTVQERAEIQNISVAGLSTTDIEKKLASQTRVVDLFGMFSSGTNLVIYVIFNENYSEEDLPDAMEAIGTEFRQLGFNITDVERTGEFLGKNCGKYILSAKVSDTEIMQEAYVLVENGYAWMVAVTYEEGKETERDMLLDAMSIYE